MEVFIELIQRIGFMIREINEMIHFPLEIDTSLSWGTITLVIILYITVNEFLRAKVLSSSDLMKLVMIYMFILGIIVACYTDIGKLIIKVSDTGSKKSLTLLFAAIVWFFILIFLIGWLGTSKNDKRKMKWVLGALYLPIFLLIITNGKILEENFETIKGFTPRFKVPFTTTRPRIAESEKQRLCCRWLDPEEIEIVIDSYPSVVKSSVSVQQDMDGVIRPYASVVLDSAVMEPGDLGKESKQKELRNLEKRIINFVRERFEKYDIQDYKIPHRIEFVGNISTNTRE